MNLAVTQTDPLNTLFLRADGRPIYHVDTPLRMLSSRQTVIARTDGPRSIEVARIQWHGSGEPSVSVRGQPVQLERSRIFANSQVFVASDRRSYKWNIDSRYPYLVRSDTSKAPVAVFTPRSTVFSSSHHPASLDITPDGMTILDDIIATYVYIEHRIQQERRRRTPSTIHPHHLSTHQTRLSAANTDNFSASSAFGSSGGCGVGTGVGF